ncbi:MAG: hypothetical protein D4R65_01350 [Verrucomicrobiaceae bacterium]|nr:MAG: hypothetical protein D4R65_01350 [Verrucomicrobiaceae bacterium]
MRTLVPELLDSLDPLDPDAIRSRNDLRRLDSFLGGSRWILRKARLHPEAARAGIVELGAGEGILCNRLAAGFPGSPVTGLDLVSAPPGLKHRIRWVPGNIFQTLGTQQAGIAVGNLILHHFSPGELQALGMILREFRVLIFSEPRRCRLALALSFFSRPFIGRITRHDMPASIRAGFSRGELAAALCLPQDEWRIHESLSSRGVVRFHACRDS